jgi:UDP-2,4-diacetamido-2,4,6-trideoxy-beta-L-altropyranose hydrolase
MDIVVRTDASNIIGTGHVMRCLTLGETMRAMGASVRFICRNFEGHLGEIITRRGFGLRLLPAPVGDFVPSEGSEYQEWLGSTWQVDAEETVAAIAASGIRPDWLVADHYGLDANWEARLRMSVAHIMAIDDLAERLHDCDILLDQNLFADMHSRYHGKVPSRCQLLLGPTYALLREEFREARANLGPRVGSVRRLLVFMGGADVANYTTTAMEAISRLKSPHSDLAVDVVIGERHSRRNEIEAACRIRGFNCHVQITHMAELMSNADLAVGAGGSASWERCCVGLPAVTVAVAHNQIAIAQDLSKFGACVYLGYYSEVDADAMVRAIERLMSDPGEIRRLSSRSFSIVDGLGATRVAGSLGLFA